MKPMLKNLLEKINEVQNKIEEIKIDTGDISNILDEINGEVLS